MQIITRQEALEKGLSKYYTGKPCRKGHLGYRYTKSEHCVGCKCPKAGIEDLKRCNETLVDPRIISRADAIVQNKTKYFTGVPCKKGHIDYRIVSGWACVSCSRITVGMFRENNPEKHNSYRRICYSRNPSVYKHQVNFRRTYKLQRTPKWADQTKIKQIYEMCDKLNKETGVSHAVDHVIPLKGKLVSGLNVPENLQILTRSQNAKKYNKFNIEDYNA